jgi:IS605 OrfB family transposase
VQWAVAQRIGTLAVGDPRGVLNLDAGRRHNLRLRQWQVGRAIAVLRDKAELAGITLHLVDERGTSSTCPACRQRIRKPAGRTMTCTACHTTGHRDLSAPQVAVSPPRRRCCRVCSRTVERDGTFPVPDRPGVTPADQRQEGRLAG